MGTRSRDHDTLGIRPGASLEEIELAYRQMVRRWHPDLFPNNPEARQAAEKKMLEINLAYGRLRRDFTEPGRGRNTRRQAAPASGTKRNFAGDGQADGVTWQDVVEVCRDVLRVYRGSPNFIGVMGAGGAGVLAGLYFLVYMADRISRADKIKMNKRWEVDIGFARFVFFVINGLLSSFHRPSSPDESQ